MNMFARALNCTVGVSAPLPSEIRDILPGMDGLYPAQAEEVLPIRQTAEWSIFPKNRCVPFQDHGPTLFTKGGILEGWEPALESCRNYSTGSVEAMRRINSIRRRL